MIVARELSKYYGDQPALAEVTFLIHAGESVVLWGGNGAGKTTILRCALGLHSFDGQLLVGGKDPRREGKAVRRMIGYVPQEMRFYDLSLGETLSFYARLRRVGAAEIERARTATGLLDIPLNQGARTLSGGMKQWLALAIALLGDPPYLMLDEPTASLDVGARGDFIALIRRLHEEGKTILFSSHRLEEAQALAGRALALAAGRLALDCSTSQLPQKLGLRRWLKIVFAPGQVAEGCRVLQSAGYTVARNGRSARVDISARPKMRVLHTLVDAQIAVTDFHILETLTSEEEGA